MSTSGAAHDRRKAVEEAAAGWYARIQLGAPSARDRRAFEDWLSSDAAHARAYDGYQKLWSTLGPAGTDPRVGAARRELLATVSAHRLRSAHWRGAAIAASVLLAFVAAGALGLAVIPDAQWQARLPTWLGGAETFATGIGQHSEVPLEDGSTVVLNTDSEVRPVYTSAGRTVRLIRGQALFNVAKDASRPFVVYAGDRRIVALGTSFDVRLEDMGLRVTLVEGRIAVDKISAPASSMPTELSPGQQFVAARGAIAHVRNADPAAVTSWRDGHLVFSDEVLRIAVAEVNRYSRTKIVLADPGLAALRISGVFRTGQTAGFLAALETRFPVQVAERRAERIVLVQR